MVIVVCVLVVIWIGSVQLMKGRAVLTRTSEAWLSTTSPFVLEGDTIEPVQDRDMSNVSSVAWEDVLGSRRRFAPGKGVHFIYQVPLSLKSSASVNVSSELLDHRVREYVAAIQKTLVHEAVAGLHLLTESVHEQFRLYEYFDDRMHFKIRTFNLNKRMTFADAVLYANRFLSGNVVAISTADTSANGTGWNKLTPKFMRMRMFGLTRHEQPGCAMTCDCYKMFDGCHDTFVFLSPLGGGDVMLEQISFRVGGLWGSENRFLWEVKKANPSLVVSNPCHTLIMHHSHCISAGNFRPSQDHRRVNVEGKSLAPPPTRLV
jgi:hypothetical protein